jgi:C4-dicarboxylate-specific signal transduction histidine kinase
MTTVPVTPGTTPELQLTTLQTLMRESRELESNLRALPEAPAVQRASTMATIADLEDRIAAIDYQLNDPAANMSDADRELFWRERVRLMKSLLQLRFAQAQRAAF